MSTYGRGILNKTGRDVMVLADLQDAQFKVGGITLDWGTFTAAVAEATLAGQQPVKVGDKYARFGQILCEITNTEVQVVTLTSATGGTFTLAGSAAIAYNATAAAVQTALEAIFGVGKVSVSGSAGGPYTVTFADSLGNVATMTVVDSTTGSGHAVAVTTSNQGSGKQGYYGPYDPAATDGRQTLTRGKCFIVNRTVFENGYGATLNNGVTDHPQVFDGGTAWKDRLIITSGAHSLAAGPTVTEFEAAFPRIAYAG